MDHLPSGIGVKLIRLVHKFKHHLSIMQTQVILSRFHVSVGHQLATPQTLAKLGALSGECPKERK